MRNPQPARTRPAVELLLDGLQVKRFTPRVLQGVEIKLETARMIGQPLPKFTVGHDQPQLFFK
jgi:hypothetical protein